MGIARSSLKKEIIDGWRSTAMDQNAFEPPTIVDLAEVAILLGFHELAQLLIDVAYALANEDITFDKIAVAFNDLSAALWLVRGSLYETQPLSRPNVNQSENSMVLGMIADAERRLRMEIWAVRQPIF